MGLNPGGPVVGYMFDDDNVNADTYHACPAVEFVKIDGKMTSEYAYDSNVFHDEIAGRVANISPGDDCLAMTAEHLSTVTAKIEANVDAPKVLFFDWDCVLQTHVGAFPFSKYAAVNRALKKREKMIRITKNGQRS